MVLLGDAIGQNAAGTVERIAGLGDVGDRQRVHAAVAAGAELGDTRRAGGCGLGHGRAVGFAPGDVHVHARDGGVGSVAHHDLAAHRHAAADARGGEVDGGAAKRFRR